MGRRARRRRPRLLLAPGPHPAAGPALDRLLGQPGGGQPDRRSRAGRALRPPQRRQRGAGDGPQRHGRDRVRRVVTRCCATSSSAATTTAAACAPRCEGHQAGAVALWLQPLRNLAATYRERRYDDRSRRTTRAGTGSAAERRRAGRRSRPRRRPAAWERGAELAVHGSVYDLEDGLLRDLEVTEGRVADAGG